MPAHAEDDPGPPGVGDPAPDFTLARAGGGVYSLAEARKEGPVVVLFFPFAFTDTCEAEFCTMTEDGPRYGQLGSSVVGVSCDAPFSQAAWAESLGLTVPLASDFDKATARAWGVLYDNWKGYGASAKRAAFVVDREGIVRYAWVSEDANAQPDYAKLKAAVEALRPTPTNSP